MEHGLPISLAIVSVCDNDRESNLLRSLGYTAYIYSKTSHYQPYLVCSLSTKLASDKTSHSIYNRLHNSSCLLRSRALHSSPWPPALPQSLAPSRPLALELPPATGKQNGSLAQRDGINSFLGIAARVRAHGPARLMSRAQWPSATRTTLH